MGSSTTRTCPPDLAGQIKRRLTMREVAERYGFRPDRQGYILCPFHAEKTGSLKLYSGDRTGWHCFGCGRGGSAIDFVMLLSGLSFHQACLRLNEDFHLGLSPGERPDPSVRRAVLEERRRAERERAARERAYREMAAEHRYWWQAKQLFGPDAADAAPGFLHPLYAEALKRLPYLEHWLDGDMGR